MDDFSLWDLMVSMFWFMLLVAWIWLLISILGDIFRDRELGGGAKAMWVLFLVFLPWLGALIYLIARGNSMNERTQQAMAEAEKRQRAYIQDVSGGSTPSVAEQIRDLSALKESGHLTDAEYEQAKSKILA
jgi:hypothetical protein